MNYSIKNIVNIIMILLLSLMIITYIILPLILESYEEYLKIKGKYKNENKQIHNDKK